MISRMDMESSTFSTYLAALFLGILIPVVIYRYITRNHDYWKKRNVPFIKPDPFISSSYGTQKKTFEDIEIERYKKYGRIYGFFKGNTPSITVAEPQLLRNILVKDFQYFTNRLPFEARDAISDKMLPVLPGKEWKRVRSIVSPAFSIGKIQKLISIFQDCAKTLLQTFKMASDKGENVDVYRSFAAFAIDVIASSAFATKIDSHNDPENIFVKSASVAFKQNAGIKFLLFGIISKLYTALGIRISVPENMLFFKRATLEIIQERKRTGQTRNDFLQLLLDSATEVEKEDHKEEKSENIVGNYGDESMDHPIHGSSTQSLSMDELIAQCVTFFLAGYHTTAVTLSVTTYLLALHQDIQEKLFKEIKDVLSETDGELKYESIQKMKHLDNILSESMRLYSPVNKLTREAGVDYKLGDTGITIPKGMIVGIPIFAMHRDPHNFPEPQNFNPDRFSPKEREKIIPYSYMPFGAGPRNCVGMRFALIEMKVCLIYLFSAFTVQTCPETKIPLEISRAAMVISPKTVILKMEPRRECPLKP